MARYDYRCTKCATVFEVEHPMSERPEVSCPECGAPAEQVFGSYGIEFKGSGYYNTDQRDSGKAPSASKCDNCPHKEG
jgi:putative FmdB family regulatory protein